MPASPELLRMAQDHGAKLVETMWSADHIVESGEEKSRLAETADVVDMESYHLLGAFASSKIPAVVLRAISDGNDEDLPVDFSRCLTKEGKVKAGPLLKGLLARPSRVPGLIRFGVRSRKAAANLAQFLDSFIAAMPPEAVKSELRAVAE